MWTDIGTMLASAWDFGRQSRLKFCDPHSMAITSTYSMPVVIWDYYLIIIKVSSPRGHNWAECATVHNNLSAYEPVTTGHIESQWVTNNYNLLKMGHMWSQPIHALWEVNEKTQVVPLFTPMNNIMCSPPCGFICTGHATFGVASAALTN